MVDIPPIPPSQGNFGNTPGSNPKAQASSIIKELMEDISKLLADVRDKNMDAIHKDRELIDKAVAELDKLMKDNPGSFTAAEKEILTGGQGLNFFVQLLDNTDDDFYDKLGEIAGTLFGLARSLEDLLGSSK